MKMIMNISQDSFLTCVELTAVKHHFDYDKSRKCEDHFNITKVSKVRLQIKPGVKTPFINDPNPLLKNIRDSFVLQFNKDVKKKRKITMKSVLKSEFRVKIGEGTE